MLTYIPFEIYEISPDNYFAKAFPNMKDIKGVVNTKGKNESRLHYVRRGNATSLRSPRKHDEWRSREVVTPHFALRCLTVCVYHCMRFSYGRNPVVSRVPCFC